MSVSPFVSPLRSSKAHPGPVVHISDNPMDEGKVKDDLFFLHTHMQEHPNLGIGRCGENR